VLMETSVKGAVALPKIDVDISTLRGAGVSNFPIANGESEGGCDEIQI
ncbi:hypothetical protein GWI33_011748, partial [Rhynchophorus ferrugineus]